MFMLSLRKYTAGFVAGGLLFAGSTLYAQSESTEESSSRFSRPGFGPGMMMHPGFGQGPGMMMHPGFGQGPGMMMHPGFGQGPGMMMHPGFGQGPGMMMHPGFGQGLGMMMHPGFGQGPGMMMHPGFGQGPGMMMHPGFGQGPGMMGFGMMWNQSGRQALPKDLSVEDVQHMLEHRLQWQINPNIKLGKVEEKDADTIVAEIVTRDDSLVQRFEIDRHTAWARPAQ